MSAPTAADEKAALEWLYRTGPCANWQPFTPDSDKPRATLKSMLQRPVMPEEPSEEAVDAMIHRGGWESRPGVRACFRESYRALYAQLAKPQEPKTKTVFYVSWTTENGSGTAGPFDGPDAASREAQNLLRADFKRTVSITPHQVSA